MRSEDQEGTIGFLRLGIGFEEAPQLRKMKIIRKRSQESSSSQYATKEDVTRVKKKADRLEFLL